MVMLCTNNQSGVLNLSVFDSVNGWSGVLKGPSTSASTVCMGSLGAYFYLAYSEDSPDGTKQLFVARSSDLTSNAWDIQQLDGQAGWAYSIVGFGQQLLFYYGGDVTGGYLIIGSVS